MPGESNERLATMSGEIPIFRKNHHAMKAFQEAAEVLGYERREMEEQIARLQSAFEIKVRRVGSMRSQTLYGLKDDPEHEMDGTPKRNAPELPTTPTQEG